MDTLELNKALLLHTLHTMAAPTGSMFEQLILAKLGEIQATLNEMKVAAGLAATATADVLKKTIQEEVSATASAKEKKKTATTESKADDAKTGAAKMTHPSLGEVTDAAWGLKKTGSDFDKRMDWFINVLTKHPTHLHAIIGTEEVARITATPEYTFNLGKCAKKGDREKAKSFLKALEEVRAKEGTFAELSAKMCADYDAQLAVRNSQKIGQLTPEVASASELAAAAAMSGLINPPAVQPAAQPVTVHTPPPATTTAAPGAQLAAAS